MTSSELIGCCSLVPSHPRRVIECDVTYQADWEDSLKVLALGIFVVSEYLPKKCLTKHPDVQFQNLKFQVNILNRSEDMNIQNLTF